MRDDNCIFCKIAAGDIPSATVYEDDMFRVILDLGPASKGHALILPKDHAANVMDLEDAYAAKALKLGAKIGKAMMEGLGCAGFNLVQNNGAAAGQTVMHFHLHVIPRYEDGERMVCWNPGSYAEGEMDATAEKIRQAL